jgi:hypothetical protein
VVGDHRIKLLQNAKQTTITTSSMKILGSEELKRVLGPVDVDD